jgi:hypothetical protein
MSMIGEIENSKYMIAALQSDLADTSLPIDVRLRKVKELEYEKQRLKQLERAAAIRDQYR